MAGTHVVQVDEARFESAVVDSSRTVPVVVDFWAGWCRPCLVLGPVLERLADEYEGRFVLAKVDVDANPGLAARFRVQGIPAVKAFRDGEVVSEFVGAQPEEVVRGFIDGLVPSESDDLAAEGSAAEAEGDADAAEAAYRRALDLRPEHQRATVGLARLLAGRGETKEARRLLARVPSDEEARRVSAHIELATGEGTDGPVAPAASAAAAGDYRRALEESLRVLANGHEVREPARDLMVRIFEVLGDEHPLTREFRPRLAAALY